MQTAHLSAKFAFFKYEMGDLRDSCRSAEKIFAHFGAIQKKKQLCPGQEHTGDVLHLFLYHKGLLN